MRYFNKAMLVASAALCLNLSVFSQNITLKTGNVTVKEAMEQLKKSSGYSFVFSSVDVNTQKRVSVSVQNASIEEAVKQILKGQNGLDYEIKGKKIIIQKNSTPASSQQKKKVMGRVVDANGEAIIGATVVIKGTNEATITDIDGNFFINASPSDKLELSMLGFTPMVLTGDKISASSPIVMKEDVQMLDEVVAIGYGSVKKSDLTGSVANVSSEKLMNQAKMNDPIQALQGQIAGADITSGNSPGSTSSIIIRGYNTLMRSGGDAPLIIVDDAPFLGSIDQINPAEIEKIDILKDASSTAIYGARGANGVIIITTKRGSKDGKMSIEYDGYFGMGKSFRDFDVMDGEMYAAYREQAHINDGAGADNAFDEVQKRVMQSGNYVDWQKLMFDNWSYKTNHSVSINTSNGRNRNMVVLGYNKDQGIIDNMAYQRFTGRFTGDMELHKNVLLGYSISVAHTDTDLGDANVWRMGTRMDPISEVYDEDGNLNSFTNKWMMDKNLVNPILDTMKENVDVQNIRNNVTGNLNLNWTIIEGLKFKSTFTYSFASTEAGAYFSPKSNNRKLTYNGANYNKSTNQQLNFTNSLNYNKIFADIHKIDVTAVHDLQTYETNAIGLAGFNIPYYGKWYNVNEAQQDVTYGSSKNEWTLLSFMGRINYTLMDRYLFTLTGRYDGSSRLAKGHKWDFFPSAAVAWRINEEPFMKDLKNLSNLKLRLSYGVSGNTAVDTYATQGQYGRYPYSFGTDEVPAWGYVASLIANPQLGWERTAELNLGLDFGLFNNRITGTLDVYERNTYDLLMERTLPTITGYDRVWENIGQIRNRGFELSLQFVPVETKDFRLSISGNVSYNKNEIVKLFNGEEDYPANNWFIGQPVSVDRFYDYLGVWQLEDFKEAKKYKQEIGTPKLKDVDGNYIYDQNDMSIHNKIPKWLAGLTISGQYKQFDFSVYAYGRFDYGTRMGTLTYDMGSTRFNQIGIYDFWTYLNPINEYPRPTLEQNSYLSGSSWAWRDLSFVRIKNINLGYTLPKEISHRFRCNNFRVYVAVDNPFLFTRKDYKGIGLDPENCNSEASARPLTTFMFGLNMKF